MTRRVSRLTAAQKLFGGLALFLVVVFAANVGGMFGEPNPGVAIVTSGALGLAGAAFGVTPGSKDRQQDDSDTTSGGPE